MSGEAPAGVVPLHSGLGRPGRPASRAALVEALRSGRIPLSAAVLSAARVEPDWVLPGLPRGDVGMIAAPGGTGKTRLGLQLAIAVALGTAWPWPSPPRPAGRVLYLAGEETEATLLDRLRAIATGTRRSTAEMDLLGERLDLHALGCFPEATLALGPGLGPLGEALLELAPGTYRLVVLDPLATFAGIDAENDNATATRLVKYLRAIAATSEAAVLVLHHVAKAAILAHQTHLAVAARGAVGLTDGVCWQAQLTRLSEESEGSPGASDQRLLVVAKANHVREGASCRLRFGPDGVLYATPAATPSSRRAPSRRLQW